MHAARMLAVFVTVGIVSELAASSAFGQANWSGSTTPQTATTYDRYGQAINSSAATISQQTQNAANTAGNALRDGLDAGFRAAEQTVNSAASQMSSSFSGNAPNQATSNNAAGSNVRSPWPTGGTAAPATQATHTAVGAPASGNGWSSIGTSVAAPPLIVPQSPMATPNYNGTAAGAAVGTTAAAAGRNGPGFPAPPANDQQSLHSVLSDPAKTATTPSNTSAPDWTKNWNNNSQSPPATISRTGNQSTVGGTAQDTGLVPVQGSSFGQSDPRATTAARPNDNWLDSGNNQSQSQTPAIESPGNRPANNMNFAGPQLNNPLNNAQSGQFANNPSLPNGQFANAPAVQSQSYPANGQFAGQANGQMPNSQQYAAYPPGSMYPTTGQIPQGQMNNGQSANNQLGAGTNGNLQTQAGVRNPEQPWVPMVLAVIGLAMSFAANLYLGASYLDARQKYQSLVRKTADTFRRVSAAAA